MRLTPKPEVEKVAKIESEFGVFWGPDLLVGSPEKKPLIEHFIYEKDVVCISADPGTGKSILLLQMLFNLTTGEPFLGAFAIPKPCNVLYVQTEGDRAETIERIEAMKTGVNVDCSRFVHINVAGLVMNTDTGIKEFMEMALAPGLHYDVIIFDPLYTTVKGSMKDDHVATDWIRNIRQIKNTFHGTAIVIAHHDAKDTYTDKGHKIERKNDTIFGSRFWQAFMSFNYKMHKDSAGKHILSLGKYRNTNTFDVLELKMIEPNPLMYIFAEQDLSTPKMQIYRLLKSAPDGMMAKELIELTHLSKAHTYRTLNALLREGKIMQFGTKASSKFKAVGEVS